MRRMLPIAALAGAASLSACGGGADEPGAAMVNAHEAAAAGMESRAAALENQADALRNEADLTREWAKDKQDVMQESAEHGVPMNEAVMNAM